jgi:4-amino-4-deoxy-L-arabinose transferase-like glycosyltransferase
MPRRVAICFAVAVACYFLYFYNLTGVGMLGPDEPRYAAVGREMARSGDWITPRLWGEPWFEKPPLVYWMTAAAFHLGLNEDLAPRLGVAFLSVGFLFFYWRILRREFGTSPAFLSTAILGTCAAWLGFSRVGVTDLPLAAAFSASMLLTLGWVESGSRRGLVPAAALLGLAVLAKGLVPLVLALPLLWVGRKRLRDLFAPAPLAVFFLIAAPWCIVMIARYGSAYVDDFFVKQHLARFATSALQHVQPFWFYAPVLITALFPWSPLAALLFRKSLYKDPRRRLLVWWLAFGFVFFSAATNKLPGYVLPLLPAAAALIGLSLSESIRAPRLLAVCALLFAIVPAIAVVLPQALLAGITHASVEGVPWLPAVAAACALGAGVWFTLRAGSVKLAVAALAAVSVVAVVWIEARTFAALDRTVSARGLWRQIEARRSEVCVADVSRGWRYNLNYYSIEPLPDCSASSRALRIEQSPGSAPYLERPGLSGF